MEEHGAGGHVSGSGVFGRRAGSRMSIGNLLVVAESQQDPPSASAALSTDNDSTVFTPVPRVIRSIRVPTAEPTPAIGVASFCRQVNKRPASRMADEESEEEEEASENEDGDEEYQEEEEEVDKGASAPTTSRIARARLTANGYFRGPKPQHFDRMATLGESVQQGDNLVSASLVRRTKTSGAKPSTNRYNKAGAHRRVRQMKCVSDLGKAAAEFVQSYEERCVQQDRVESSAEWSVPNATQNGGANLTAVDVAAAVASSMLHAQAAAACWEESHPDPDVSIREMDLNTLEKFLTLNVRRGYLMTSKKNSAGLLSQIGMRYAQPYTAFITLMQVLASDFDVIPIRRGSMDPSAFRDSEANLPLNCRAMQLAPWATMIIAQLANPDQAPTETLGPARFKYDANASCIIWDVKDGKLHLNVWRTVAAALNKTANPYASRMHYDDNAFSLLAVNDPLKVLEALYDVLSVDRMVITIGETGKVITTFAS